MKTQTQTRLQLFLDALRGSGFECLCNWEQNLYKNKGRLENYTIHKDGQAVNVVFQEFDKDHGFTHYIESSGMKFDNIIQEFQEMMNRKNGKLMEHTKGDLSMVLEGNSIEIRSEQQKRTICEIADANEKDIANAKRMVKTWNMYDELIEALKRLTDAHYNGKVQGGNWSNASQILKQAE